MIFDSEHKGLECIYKPWQVEALRFIMLAKKPVGTLEVYKALEARGCHSAKSDGLSRASVINFLTCCLEDGILDAVTTSGKGGMRPNYMKNMNSADEATLRRVLRLRLTTAIEEELA